MSRKKSEPLLNNTHVKAIMAVMEQHHTDAMKDLLDVIGYVGEVEKQLDAAVQGLAVMRRELADMRQGPLKTALQNAVLAIQNQVNTLRDRLELLKESVIESCKDLMAAFREKGVQALSNAARFFRVRPGLEAMRDGLTESIKADERILAKIEAASAEYHKAGRHVKNMGRALVGREAVSEAKASGKVAGALAAPFKAERSCFLSARKSVDNALDRLARLEKSAERKPSIRETMQRYQAQIDQTPRPAPVRDGPRQER